VIFLFPLNLFQNQSNPALLQKRKRSNIPFFREFCYRSFIKHTCIVASTMNTKITAVMAAIVAAGLFGAVTPALAQNTSVNTDDDITLQENKIKQVQEAKNSANAGNVKGDGNIVAGNNAAAVSFQDQEAFAANINIDDDVFETLQVDICAFVDVAIIC
jgi:uncharacterized protein YdeI (BOF family)